MIRLSLGRRGKTSTVCVPRYNGDEKSDLVKQVFFVHGEHMRVYDYVVCIALRPHLYTLLATSPALEGKKSRE